MHPTQRWMVIAAVAAALACGTEHVAEHSAGDDGQGAGDPDGGDGSGPQRDGAGQGGGETHEGHGQGGDSDDGDADVEGSGEGSFCSSTDYQFTFDWNPPHVMLVLDESGSMLTPWDHDGDPDTNRVTRWNSLHRVVDLVTSDFEARMNLGVKLFPSPEVRDGEDLCFVDEDPDVPTAPLNAEAIMAAIPAADDDEIRGGTPATAGIAVAHAHLHDLGGDATRAMILVTDGAANCREGTSGSDVGRVYDENLETTVGEAFSGFGTPTYVVGINIVNEVIDSPGNPVVNPYVSLNMVALAGGAARTGEEKFYNAWNEADLTGALDEVAARIECTFVLDEEPVFPEEVRVEIDGEAYDRGVDCSAGAGWRYTDGLEGAGAIELCTDACAALQEVHSLEVFYDCPQDF